MKTRFVLSALAVAAIAFIGCNKIEKTIDVSKNSNTPFEFTATSIDTKTTNDGVHTYWAAGDQVALFHAEAGSDSYAKDNAFTASAAGASTTFTGTLTGSLTVDNYDWYAIYPYNSNISTPANTGTKGWVTVGSASNAKQNQTGNSNKTHIAGEGYPVAGKVLNVAKATQPEISMSHLTSLVEVNVTNGTGSDITVTEVSFTGTEDIVGTYFINFVSSPVGYTESGPSYVSSTATLQVTSGATIAKDASATFYLAVKPFTAPKDGTLTLAVTADNGKQSKDKVLSTSAFSFNAGEINTLNFTYDKAGSGKTLQTLFHESFGDNTGSARAWDDSYSVKTGVAAVYSGITSYTVDNVKQGKNTTGSTLSGLNQSVKGTDAYIIIGPLNVATAEDMVLTYQWKAASTKETYSTSLYYATSSGGAYTEVSGTGAGASSFVERSYNLPVAAQVSTLYLKIVWNTSNTQAIIDEVNLQGMY